MKLKFVLGALLAVAVTSGMAATSTLSFNSKGYASFGGTASGDVFFFTLSSPSDATGLVISSLLSDNGSTFSGFDITSVTLDGGSKSVGTDSLTSFGGQFYVDTYKFTGELSAGSHYFTVLGSTTNGGTYSGGLSVSAVPEGSGYAMSLAGMGIVGFIARRRSVKA